MPDARRIGAAIRRTAAPGIVVPAAAPAHPARAATSMYRVIRFMLPVGTLVICILTPFPHVPVKVIDAESVGSLLPNRVC